jgi:hypothetical protein
MLKTLLLILTTISMTSGMETVNAVNEPVQNIECQKMNKQQRMESRQEKNKQQRMESRQEKNKKHIQKNREQVKKKLQEHKQNRKQLKKKDRECQET